MCIGVRCVVWFCLCTFQLRHRSILTSLQSSFVSLVTQATHVLLLFVVANSENSGRVSSFSMYESVQPTLTWICHLNPCMVLCVSNITLFRLCLLTAWRLSCGLWLMTRLFKMCWRIHWQKLAVRITSLCRNVVPIYITLPSCLSYTGFSYIPVDWKIVRCGSSVKNVAVHARNQNMLTTQACWNVASCPGWVFYGDGPSTLKMIPTGLVHVIVQLYVVLNGSDYDSLHTAMFLVASCHKCFFHA